MSIASRLAACTTSTSSVVTAPGDRRASVALLLASGKANDEYVLFIKRAANDKDPWSGDVAFPGGKRDPADKSDEDTAIREVLEEVGLDVSDEGRWRRLGKIADDRVVQRGHSKHMVVSTFGFELLEKDGALPAPITQPDEVAYAWWVPVSHLRPELLRMQRLPLDKYRFTTPVRLLLQAVGTEGIGFASLPLPLPALATEEPPLWGLTLTLTSDVLTRAGAATLVGPGAAVPAFSHPFGIAGGTIGDDMIRVMLMARKHQRALSRLLGTSAVLGGLAVAVALARRGGGGRAWLSAFRGMC